MHSENPWQKIPYEDYENHMSASNVGQLKKLSEIIKARLDFLRPISFAILGSATGNGFEHVNNNITKVVYGIDINQQYLDVAKARYGEKINDLRLICADISTDEIKVTGVELLIGALVFEYVDIPVALAKVREILDCDGLFVAILQKSHDGEFVTGTEYRSLQTLEPITHEISEFEFHAEAVKHGLHKTNRESYPVGDNKELIALTFRKGMK